MQCAKTHAINSPGFCLLGIFLCKKFFQFPCIFIGDIFRCCNISVFYYWQQLFTNIVWKYIQYICIGIVRCFSNRILIIGLPGKSQFSCVCHNAGVFFQKAIPFFLGGDCFPLCCKFIFLQRNLFVTQHFPYSVIITQRNCYNRKIIFLSVVKIVFLWQI